MEFKFSDRQKREREYYDVYSKQFSDFKVSFDPISGKESRPWNPYWFTYEYVKKSYTDNNDKLLDFGCGIGANSVLFARIGYEVFGFDISPCNIKIANDLAARYRLNNKTHFTVGISEKIEYPSDFFDVIVGIDILHHSEIEPSIKECSRVLKKGGIAIFKEPVWAPLLDNVRYSKFFKLFLPAGKTFNPSCSITDDEKKLTKENIIAIQSFFERSSSFKFSLFAKFRRFLRMREGKPSILEMLDYYLFKSIPKIQIFGSELVLILQK